MEHIGDKLKKLRLKKHLKQIDIADLLNIKQNTYSDYELNKILPPITKLYKLSKFYEVKIDEIITDHQKNCNP
jgi:transcriptional regulator with XRE-family HTH domain